LEAVSDAALALQIAEQSAVRHSVKVRPFEYFPLTRQRTIRDKDAAAASIVLGVRRGAAFDLEFWTWGFPDAVG
jgi:hypothetical protein